MIRNPNIPTVNGLPVPYKFTSRQRDDAVIMVTKPCVLFNVWVDYSGAADAYLHVFESSELPVNGIVPTLPPLLVRPDTYSILDCMPGCPMVAGVTVALSSTRDILTRVGSNDGKFTCLFHPLDDL